jgi:hypothetical protein
MVQITWTEGRNAPRRDSAGIGHQRGSAWTQTAFRRHRGRHPGLNRPDRRTDVILISAVMAAPEPMLRMGGSKWPLDRDSVLQVKWEEFRVLIEIPRR